MATGGSLLSQISDDFLECKICLEPYRRPKVLSCLHTFCQECLELLYKRQDKPRQLECPTCRTKTELPGSGISTLKDNFFVESLKDTVKLHKTVKETEGSRGPVCGLCESGGEARSYCMDCTEFVCKECISAHRRMKSLKGHQLISIEEVRSGAGLKTAKPRTQPCRLHEDESLKFYCETCGEAVCRDCIMIEHKDHSYIHIAKASAGIREELAAALGDADKRLAELKAKQGEVLSKKYLLKDTATKVKESINEAAEQIRKRLVDQVNKEQQELLKQVQDIEKKTEKEFCTVEDTVESAIVALTSTTEFGRSIIAHGTDLEITNVKTKVQTRLQSLLQLSPTEIQLPEGEPWVRLAASAADMDDHVPLIGEIIEGGHFNGATFTTLGTTGRHGPTDLLQHYSGQDHDGLVTLKNGIQYFTAKQTGTYRIEAAGAAAGWGLDTPKSARGRGALMKGTFRLRKDDVLNILVGQEAVQDVPGRGVGGGGGTFVTRADNTPLIIAGGGGGGNYQSHRNKSSEGTKETTGNPSSGGNVGGKDGAGAIQGGSGDVGGGGGGLLTDGASGKRNFGGKDGRIGGEGGRAFVNGGTGGRGSCNNADGGFGGGGGGFGGFVVAEGGGGGGGGYSGGGRGDDARNQCGGGGGSFNSGAEPYGESGANDGPGYVVVTLTG